MLHRRSLQSLFALLLGLAFIPLIGNVGEHYRGFVSVHGNSGVPAPGLLALIAAYTTLGLPAAILMAVGLTGLIEPARFASFGKRFRVQRGDAVWIAAGMLFVFVAAIMIRQGLLLNLPLTDDEDAYRFSAQLLASGRLYGEVPQPRAFFHRQFMMTGGDKWFTQYYLGWPAMLAPFMAAGLEHLANPFYGALTVPPLYWTAQRMTGRSGARLTLIFYATSSQFLVSSASQLSHTSCWLVLTWMAWATLEVRRGRQGWWLHTLIGTMFGLAVFTRPLTAMGVGAPLLVLWAYDVVSGPRIRWGALVALAIPGAVLGAAFFGVNEVYTGAPLGNAYDVVFEHHRELDYRFGGYLPSVKRSGQTIGGRSWFDIFSVFAGTIVRLQVSLLGWPWSFVFLPFALFARRARWLWWVIIGHMVSLYWSTTAGIDSFAPLKSLEASIPLLWLSAIGFQRVCALGRHYVPNVPGLRGPFWSNLVVVCLLLNAQVYIPARFGSLASASDFVSWIRRVPARNGVSRGIVFMPLVNPRCNPGGYSFVGYRPLNKPDLSNDLWWVNDLGPENNRAFAAAHPDRKPYLLSFTSRCQLRFAPLDSPP